MSDTSQKPAHSTPEPFTDPNSNKEGIPQKAAKTASLPLAAVGGALAEMTRKAGELLTGHSTKIDTSKKDEPR
ncbi:hypothetical protein BX616_008749 [Lobosporangium transversale]|nr:hypothetical protein BX616_008749 [Lobosporangium transversale]